MINFGCIYLIVKDFNKSLNFYNNLFERDVISQNMDRFAIFDVNGFQLCILNGYFDSENPDKVICKGKAYDQYDDFVFIAKQENSKKIVINLETADLRSEHKRISELKLGTDLTEIRYINAGMPYYYFSMKDPDDNIIEITGGYIVQDGEDL